MTVDVGRTDDEGHPQGRAALSAADLEDVVGRYFDALGRFDLDAAAACFTEDVFYSHPPYAGETEGRHEVVGRDALVALFRHRGHRPAVRHSVDMVALNGRAGAVAGTFTPDDTQRGSFVSVVTLADDGRIASYAAYVSVPAVGISDGR